MKETKLKEQIKQEINSIEAYDYSAATEEIMEMIDSLIEQRENKLLRKILKKFSGYNDGCGCCMEERFPETKQELLIRIVEGSKDN